MGKKVSQQTKESEAATLRQLLSANKISNYAAFAREFSVPGGKAMVNQHLTGERPISLEAAISYAIGFGQPLHAISPRLASIIERLPKAHQPSLCVSEPVKNYPTNVVSLNTENPLRRELADIALRMSDTALQVLLYEAKKIDKEYPAAKTNPAS